MVRLVFSVVALMLMGTITWAAERPHQVRGHGQFVSPTDFVGCGVATHLGRYRETGNVQFAPTADPAVVQITGSATLVAANGDHLVEQISGVLNLQTGAGVATMTFVGGTGRFATASGSATFALQLFPNGSFAYTGKGSIDY
ncbi:MAG: hypothetical protein U0795_03945 [Pirellulales bacterium]